MSDRVGSERVTQNGKPAWSEILDLGPRPARTPTDERQRTYGWSDPAEVARVAPETSGLEFLQKMINGEVASSALSRTLDFDLVEASAGRVVVTARPAEFQCNAIGTVHGGVIASWADTAMGYAIQSRLPAGVSLTTLDIQVRYLRAVRPDDGSVSIIGTADHVGRRTGVARAEIYNDQDKLLATATTSCLILPARSITPQYARIPDPSRVGGIAVGKGRLIVTVRGEYKVPGGKLVAADVEVADQTLSSVRISGDFFLEPDDALESIDRALTGLPEDASVAQMSAVVAAAIGPDAHLIGFDADAVAIAVRRAVGRATSWSDHTFEIVHGSAETPQLQMALDQALTEAVADGTRGPTLRIWEWERNAVVIGSFQSYRNEIDQEAADKYRVTVVRRISGGGAMFIEPGNTITYSLYVPGSLVEGLSFERSYAFLDDWVLGALSDLGIAARYVPLNDITSPIGKIGGAAQKRLASRDPEARNKLGGAVLHHVTMSYDIDANKMTQVLRIGREKLSDKGTTSANKRVDPLRSQTGMARSEVIESFKDHFRSRYATTDGAITDQERARAEQLVTEKFGTDEWLHRVP